MLRQELTEYILFKTPFYCFLDSSMVSSDFPGKFIIKMDEIKELLRKPAYIIARIYVDWNIRPPEIHICSRAVFCDVKLLIDPLASRVKYIEFEIGHVYVCSVKFPFIEFGNNHFVHLHIVFHKPVLYVLCPCRLGFYENKKSVPDKKRAVVHKRRIKQRRDIDEFDLVFPYIGILRMNRFVELEKVFLLSDDEGEKRVLYIVLRHRQLVFFDVVSVFLYTHG